MSKNETPFQFTDYVIVAAITLGVLLLVPLIAVVGFALQFGFVLAAPIVLIASTIHAFGTRPEVIVTQVQGIDVPNDVRLYRRHSWARRAAANCVVAGIDDFAQRLVGPIESIDTPLVGKVVAEGDVLAVVRRGDRELPVRAPVAGVVSQINPALAKDPSVVNRAPYGQGWLVEVTPEKATVKQSLKQLFGGGRALRWMRAEVDRLAMLTAPPELAHTLADGGELSPDVHTHLDEPTWRRVVDEFFA
ncbi:MAG: glycine cleavage system protein H [Deltaproteobacteria bacterium]|nr:glycine cleavage system protein H [Deltaproteobacteria bacterium]